MIIEHDSLQRFVFEHSNIRGELVRLRDCYRTAYEKHPYPPNVRYFLGETLAASALLSATIKYSGNLTLQVQGEGPLHLLVAQSNHQLDLRGLAKWHGEEVPKEFAKAAGDAYLAITITPEMGERYQGIVKIEENSLSKNLETYFKQSEQLPTRILLASNDQEAAGLLLQVLPKEEENHVELWEQAQKIMENLSTEALLNMPNQWLLQQFSDLQDVRFYQPQPLQFHCSCTIPKMERALQFYGYEEVQDILKTHRYVTVTCEFCHQHYDFDPVDVGRIFFNPDLPPDTKH
jgi:molecular chaperone Hsp33